MHPFVDGNGRMCRFLSKFILDSVCPLPFPMFPKRKPYLQALIVGRTLPPKTAPQLLAELLLDVAVATYRTLLGTFARRPFDRLVAASSLQDLQPYFSNDQDKRLLEKTFESLRDHQSQHVTLSTGFVLRILKIDEWSIDDL